ncbi:class I SAM-dependent methyltransferase [Halorarius halobius]|uniref:class I SAM-dependent methyltransferase n=1 Tax=Halorarius halobius TaxID=2962671 RepID=UPI0020CC6468|nr:class I SAM-dependent methyltransferase [Halorarius halobius]
MTDTDYDGTIDWDDYWDDADDQERGEASPAAHHAGGVLADFVAETGADSVADVGCGAGAATFAVAEAHPEVSVVGYDAAPPVLAENRERAREAGVNNARFEEATLPAFDPDRQFDVVFSYFTLQYVRDVERALRNLYAAVEPGGALLFNYLNEAGREYCLESAEDPEANADRAFVFDPEQYTDRFEALLDGDSVLSEARIEATLGVEPRDAFEVVERPDVQWAWHHAPLVYVPKPDEEATA